MTDGWSNIVGQNLLILSRIHAALNEFYFSCARRCKATPKNNASSTVLDSGDSVLFVKGRILFLPHVTNVVVAEQLNFCFICPKNFLPKCILFVDMSFGKVKRILRCFGDSSGFLLATRPCSPSLFSARRTVL